MKLKNGFMLREVAGASVVIAVGEAARAFRGVGSLNGTAACLIRALRQDTTVQELVGRLTEEYAVAPDQAERDVGHFIQRLRDAGMLAE